MKPFWLQRKDLLLLPRKSFSVEACLTREILAFRRYANYYEEWKAGFAHFHVDKIFFDAFRAQDWGTVWRCLQKDRHIILALPESAIWKAPESVQIFYVKTLEKQRFRRRHFKLWMINVFATLTINVVAFRWHREPFRPNLLFKQLLIQASWHLGCYDLEMRLN